MKPGLAVIVPLAIALGTVISVSCRTPPPFGADQRRSLGEAILTGWSGSSRATAAAMIERYGPPDALASGALAWKNKGPWKKIVVWDLTEDYLVSRGTSDNLEQTVAYQVPDDRRGELAAFSPKLRVAQDGATLSARSDSEELNFLVLNLADRISRGVTDAARARLVFQRAVDLSRAGKSSGLMKGLLFFPASP